MDYTVFDTNSIAYNRWIDPGASLSLGIDTRVRATFWHNNTDLGDITAIDSDEKVFGQVARIPLPNTLCQRVEGGFSVTTGVPDVALAVAMDFRLFEDGRIVASGTVTGANPTLVIPEDLLNPPAGLLLNGAYTPDDFLNFAPPLVPLGVPHDCNTDTFPDQDRLGDDGDPDAEPGNRRRDVKYVLQVATVATMLNSVGVPVDIADESPASVEFTVTARSGAPKSADQAIKSFKRE